MFNSIINLVWRWSFCYFLEVSAAPAAPRWSAVVANLYFPISWIFWEQACCHSSYIPMSSSLEIIWSHEDWCLWQHSTCYELCNRGSSHFLSFFGFVVTLPSFLCSIDDIGYNFCLLQQNYRRMSFTQYLIAIELEWILFIQISTPSVAY
jgi:hypothetical protein